MKIIDKLTQRLDHMVPDKSKIRISQNDIEAFQKALMAEEEKMAKLKRTK
jgi:hypothetical protein